MNYREYLEQNILESEGEVIIPVQKFEKVDSLQIRGKIELHEQGCFCYGEERSRIEKYRMKRLSEVVQNGDSNSIEILLNQWKEEDEIFSKPEPISINQ